MLRFHPKRRYKVQVKDRNGKEFIVKVKAPSCIHAAIQVEERLGKKNIEVVDVVLDKGEL